MEFLAKYDKDTGELIFPSTMDKFRHDQMVEFYKKTGTYFRFSLVEHSRDVTSNQINLFKRLVIMVSKDSGMEYKEVYDRFHLDHAITEDTPGLFGPIVERRKDVSELNVEEFEIFISRCLVTANEFFNMNLVLYSNEEVGTVLTKAKE